MRDERVFAAFKEYCTSFRDPKGKWQQCKVCHSRCHHRSHCNLCMHACTFKHVRTSQHDQSLRFVQVDEHYFSTLLAMQRRDQETDCKGGLVGCTCSMCCRAMWPSAQVTKPMACTATQC
jgi:hypothetical protein